MKTKGHRSQERECVLWSICSTDKLQQAVNGDSWQHSMLEQAKG